jgi:leucyl-tRNA---protein transferase
LFSHSYTPKSAKGAILDKYLQLGFFRSGYKIFTTTFLQVGNDIYNTHWLRLSLPNFHMSEKQKNLFQRNKKFKTVVRKLELNDEKELLFSKYRASMKFITSPSLFFLLHDFNLKDTYNSWEVCIYDEEKLIGFGVLDLGKESCAGITSIYDPDYAKYSIGKYVILSKIIEAKRNGFHWFYPGYFTTNYAPFDYKLDLDKKNTEYLDYVKSEWSSMDQFEMQAEPLQIIRKKLDFIASRLRQSKNKYEILRYKFFDCNLYIDFKENKPLTEPYFLMLYSDGYNFEILYFNVFESMYEIMSCIKLYEVQDQKYEVNVYTDGILVADQNRKIQFDDALEALKYIKSNYDL